MTINPLLEYIYLQGTEKFVMKMVRELFDLPEDKDAWITSYKWSGLKMASVPLVPENSVTFILDIKLD